MACSNDVSDSDIIRYVNGAICLINLLATSLTSKTERIKLCAGSVHHINQCDRVLNVIGQTDSDGKMMLEVKTPDDDEKRVIARLSSAGFATRCKSAAACSNDAQFRLTSIQIESSGTTIITQPPVPLGGDVWLLVTCSGELETILEGKDCEVPCKWSEIIMQWVLFRITFPRADDEYTFPRANTHARLFAELIGVSLHALEKADRSTSDGETSDE